MLSFLEYILAFGVMGLESLRTLSDDDLIQNAKQQKEESHDAFRVLVERHHTWMVRMSRGLISNPDDAEEIVQNALTRAFFALPKFRGDASFKSWVRVILSREAFAHYKRSARTPKPMSEFMNDDGEVSEVQIASDKPLEQDRADERDAMHLALQGVPYPYREILVLRYVEELSMEEISNTLELGLSAAKMRLKRAREFFRESYDTQAET